MKKKNQSGDTIESLKGEYANLLQGRNGELSDKERVQLLDIGERALQGIVKDLKKIRDTVQTSQGTLTGDDIKSITLEPVTDADLKRVWVKALLQQLSPDQQRSLARLLRNTSPDQRAKILKGLITIGKISRYHKASKNKLN